MNKIFNKKFIAYAFVAFMILAALSGVAGYIHPSQSQTSINIHNDETGSGYGNSFTISKDLSSGQYAQVCLLHGTYDAGQSIIFHFSQGDVPDVEGAGGGIWINGNMAYFLDGPSTSGTYSCTPSSSGTISFKVGVANGVASDPTYFSATCTLTINSDPVPSISPSATSLDLGQSITLNASTSGGTSSYSYAWLETGPSGSSSYSGNSITVSPPDIGNYTFSVTVTDATGATASANVSIPVYSDPTLSVTSSSNPGDVGQSILFESSASGGSGVYKSYSYILHDGPSSSDSTISTGTDPSFSYTFESAGDYLLNYSVMDSNGYYANTSFIETINTDPSVSITSSVNPVDTGVPVEFKPVISGGTPPDSFEWEAAGNTYTSQDINVTFSATGSQVVTLTITDKNGYTASSTFTETVNANPDVEAYANVSETDININVLFTSLPKNGTGPFNFTWSENGLILSYSENYTTSFASPGSYTLEITIRDSFNVSRSGNVSVTVNPNPTVSISVSLNKTDVGVPQTFKAAITGGTGPFTLDWYENNNLASTNASFVFNVSTTGSYNISLIVKDKYDRIADSNTIDEIVVSDPVISLTYSQSPVVSTSVTIYSHIVGGVGNFSLTWSFPGGTTTGRNVSYAFSTAGNRTFSIQLTDGSGYKHTQSFTVYVSLDIVISESAKTGNAPLTVEFSSEALGGSSYIFAWNFGNGNTSDSQSAINVFAPGNYTVTLDITDSAGVTGSASVLIQAWPAPVTFVYSNNQNITYDFHFQAVPNWDAAGPYNVSWGMPNGQVLYGLNVSYYFPTYSKTNDISVDFSFSNTSIYQGDTYSKTIVVTMKPANISVSFSYPDPIPVNTILDLNVSVTAPDTNSFVIDWNVSGTYGTGGSFTYDFSSPGTFYINITVTDNLGASTHLSKVITVQKLAASSDISIGYTKTTDASIIGYNISVHSKYPIQSVQAYLDGSLLTMNMTYSGGNATAGYTQYYTFSLNQRDYSTGDYQINIDAFSSHSKSNSAAVPFVVSSQYSNSAPFNIVAFLGGIDNTIYILIAIGGIIVTVVLSRPKTTDINVDGTVLQARPGKSVKELKRRK